MILLSLPKESFLRIGVPKYISLKADTTKYADGNTRNSKEKSYTYFSRSSLRANTVASKGEAHEISILTMQGLFPCT